jgi:amylosucrase
LAEAALAAAAAFALSSAAFFSAASRASTTAAAVGWSGGAHRAFLSDYYTGVFPGSTARGEVFQPNELTGDRRVSGSAASLAGLEAALDDGDPAAIAPRWPAACAYAMVLGFGGLPLIYGDELALLNDATYLTTRRTPTTTADAPPGDGVDDDVRPAQERAAGRAVAESRPDGGGAQAAGRCTPACPPRCRCRDAAVVPSCATTRGTLVQVYNVSEGERRVPLWDLAREGITRPFDELTGRPARVRDEFVVLEPYAACWFSQQVAD